MRSDSPSQTALGAAYQRALHQVVDSPLVFEDDLALAILGRKDVVRERLRSHESHTSISTSMRAYFAARARLTEDLLADACAKGASQYVILGAGFDTFAYRSPLVSSLRVFEVDFEATQIAKVKCLAANGIAIPPGVRMVPMDLERESLASALDAVRFQWDRVTFVAWLGVTYYLTESSFWSTVESLMRLAQGSEVVLDFFVPLSEIAIEEARIFQQAAQQVHSIGEPYRLHLGPKALGRKLLAMGFRSFSPFCDRDLNRLFFDNRNDGLRVTSSVVRIGRATL
jgi:methyltransferase (TIGR00027 family)